MKKAKGKPGRTLRPLAAALVFLLLAGGAMAVWRLGQAGTARLDSSAVPIPQKGPSEQELQETLQKQVEESFFRFRVDAAPVFESETAVGTLNLFNSVENSQSMYVTLSLDGTGDELYRSAVLPPGGSAVRGRLTVPLEAGTYSVTATAHILDPETGGEIGTVAAAVVLTVES